jgi:hypothetical protein
VDALRTLKIERKGTSFGAGKEPLMQFIAVAVLPIAAAKLYLAIVT